MPYKIEIINNQNDLVFVKDKWDQLYEKSGKSVSQSYDFSLHSSNYDIKKNEDMELYFILFFNDRELKCILPFLKKKRSIV